MERHLRNTACFTTACCSRHPKCCQLSTISCTIYYPTCCLRNCRLVQALAPLMPRLQTFLLPWARSSYHLLQVLLLFVSSHLKKWLCRAFGSWTNSAFPQNKHLEKLLLPYFLCCLDLKRFSYGFSQPKISRHLAILQEVTCMFG